MPATARSMTTSQSDTGLQVTPIAADNTNGEAYPAVVNGSSNVFVFYNPTGGAITATLKVASTTPVRVPGVGNVTPADKALSIGASKFGVFEILPGELPAYTDADGKINLTYSATGLLAMGLGTRDR